MVSESVPLVSVIIPAYNAETTIGSTLKSLINQTYNKLEILVIDDGSSDKTAEVVEDYIATDSRVNLKRRDNGGAGAARNAGLEMVTGDYVTFVDSDDLLNQFAIEVLVSISTDCNADIAIGKHQRFISNIQEPDLSTQVDWEGLVTVVAAGTAIESILYKMEHEGVCGNLYRTDLLRGLSFPPIRVYEDACFNLSALSNAKKCALLRKPLYWYRQRDESLTHTYSPNFEQGLLSGYRAILSDVSRRSLISAKAISFSLFCYASNLLWRIDSNSESRELWDTIKKTRFSTIFDNHASAKYRVAAICSLLGWRGFKVIGERALRIQRVEK
ncbi:glycosyltransferase family 2 protein [Candidatus Collinsella stercoripullorum]|uniref:glycosyltransferase family 2 protein n=1 Tax=Candidatus Collinsella stercoripullorum TaxID=2838522 RepID=UPI0022E276F3|nr:glycosyltransferase family 2 protein [Candidatus Collinsella stercoripullorum]